MFVNRVSIKKSHIEKKFSQNAAAVYLIKKKGRITKKNKQKKTKQNNRIKFYFGVPSFSRRIIIILR